MDWGQVSFYVYRLGGAVAPRVPPRLGYRLADLAGTVLCRLSPARVHVEDNVAHVVGRPADTPEVQRIVRRVFRNQCKNYYDLLRVATLSREEILAIIRDVHGIEHVDHALARGHGIVLAGAHFGNIDLAGQVLALRGYKVTALAEHIKPERLFQYVRAQRESHGLSFVPIDRLLRPAFRALRNGEIVGSAIDRNVTDEGRPVQFFGCPARLPDGYLRLALHTQAALLLCFCRRLPDNTFVIDVEPEVVLERSGDQERDIAASMPRVVSVFESHLRRDPDQWVYFQPVWPGACGPGANAAGSRGLQQADSTRLPE